MVDDFDKKLFAETWGVAISDVCLTWVIHLGLLRFAWKPGDQAATKGPAALMPFLLCFSNGVFACSTPMESLSSLRAMSLVWALRISAWIPVIAEKQIFLLWETNCRHFGRILMKEPNPGLFKRGISLQPQNHRVSCLSWQRVHLNKESDCHAGDSGSIPGLRRFPWRRAW